jgi:lysophospholipase L1-like esterase
MRRFRWLLGGVVLLFVAALVGVLTLTGPSNPSGTPIARQGPPGTGPLTMVSLGDSTISGEGAGDYTPDTDGSNGDWCHRSPNAEVFKTQVPGVTAKVNLACSGAPAGQVALGAVKQWTEPSQAQQLATVVKNHRVTDIVVGIGANDDPHFSALVTGCFKAWLDVSSPPCSDDIKKTWKSKVDAMVPKVVNALGDIKKVLADAGYVPADYQLVVQSYASPIGPGIPENLRTLNGCPFRTEDLKWVSQDGVAELASGLHAAAKAAGARFLDLSRAGLGHEACSGGQNPASEWFSRLTLQLSDLSQLDRATHALQESFHPNAAGHAQFAHCLSEFLGGSDENAACLSGTDGQLHAATEVATP